VPAIHAHLDGSAADAWALKQAIDAVIQRIKVKDYAEAHEELKADLTVGWLAKQVFKCKMGESRFPGKLFSSPLFLNSVERWTLRPFPEFHVLTGRVWHFA
jgi:hypothetical protein